MLARTAAILLCTTLAASAAAATELRPDEARRFVVGKLFAFTCFDGTRGAGRIRSDGSVAGIIQFSGSGAFRSASLPAGTLQVKGERVCASLRGVPFEPCFTVDKKDAQSFRGSVAGLNFAYCDFTRRGGRVDLVSNPPHHAPARGAAVVAHE